MDRALVCQMLGLPVTATDEEIKAKAAAINASAAQASVLTTQLAEVGERERQRTAELDAAHVEAEITRLKTTRQVGDPVIASLRDAAKVSRTSFDSSLKLVEASAPVLAPGPGAIRAELQSDKKPTENPGSPGLELAADGPDALDANRTNANLPRYMKACGISAENVRKHGSSLVEGRVLPNLRELADNTDDRGERMGVGK